MYIIGYLKYWSNKRLENIILRKHILQNDYIQNRKVIRRNISKMGNFFYINLYCD